MTLKVGVGSGALNYGAFWVAEENGLFTKYGVNVTVVSYNTGSNTADMVAAGQVDLELFTAPLGLELTQKGKPVQFVAELAAFSASTNAMISSTNVTSISQLASVSGCRIATTAPGIIPYVYSVRFIKAANLTNCSLVETATIPAEIAAVESGSSQAASVPYASALPALKAKKVNLLVDPLHVTPTLAKKLVPTPYPAFVVFGLTTTLKANKVGVVRFLKALRQASTTLAKESNTTLGKKTAALSAFAGSTVTQLSVAWSAVRPTIPTGSNAGFISSSVWSTALTGFTEWKLPTFNPKDPAFAYNKIVNMTYFNQAK